LGGFGQPERSYLMANNIVILQNDPARARTLEASVKSVSSAVFTVRSMAELRKLVAQSSIRVGVVDLDLVTFQEIARLRQIGIEIVCTHHAPDDRMWTDALGAGAFDCCFDEDAPSICKAVQKSMAA
jgi:hypothetical protein